MNLQSPCGLFDYVSISYLNRTQLQQSELERCLSAHSTQTELKKHLKFDTFLAEQELSELNTCSITFLTIEPACVRLFWCIYDITINICTTASAFLKIIITKCKTYLTCKSMSLVQNGYLISQKPELMSTE